MTSSMIIILVAFGAVLVYGIIKLLKKDPEAEKLAQEAEQAQAQASQNAANAMPQNLKEIYERGMNPTQYAEPTFYTLTKCVHCGRLEKYLIANSIPYTKVLLDDFEGASRQNILRVLREYNERGSFPTLVAPDGKVSVGFREWSVYDNFMRYTTDAEKLAKYEESLKKK